MNITGTNLCLKYGAGSTETYAVRDIDISIRKGELTGIIGPSGSGKSSLLYLLSGLKKPTSGSVFFDGVDLRNISSKSLAVIRKGRFGFVFQRHFLIDYLNVLDNVLVVLNSKDSRSVSKALNILNRLGIEDLAYKKISKLSVGQRQRTAIARAFINDPEVIFADEPSASLDHKNANDIMELFNEYKENAAVIIVTHDRKILNNADKVFEICDGNIINSNPF